MTCLRALRAIFICHRLTMTTLLRLLVAILSVATLFVAVEAGSNEASKAWLAENAKKDGVHVLPSGLQYRVLRKVRTRAFAMFVLMRSYHVLVYTFVISHEYLPFILDPFNQGSGTDHPTVDSPCSCHYEGTLIDGTKFDSSYDRGSPTTFAPNQVSWAAAPIFTYAKSDY